MNNEAEIWNPLAVEQHGQGILFLVHFIAYISILEYNGTVRRITEMMRRRFNTTGLCLPDIHYMVNIEERLEEIKAMVDEGEYLTINRARQFGKTTTLWRLKEKLREQYEVFLISFEGMTKEVFRSETAFCRRFYSLLANVFKYEKGSAIPSDVIEECNRLKSLDSEDNNLFCLSEFIAEMCAKAGKPIVLMIDEVDQAGNYDIFMGFLGMLRDKFLKRTIYPTFQAVILAGVQDVKNIKSRIRPDGEHQYNSPWNIAADFDVDMSLSSQGIAGMLMEYEQEQHTGMDIQRMAALLYEYTSGYPFLVSRICKLMDERVAAWTKEGFLEAVRMLLSEENTLFESLDNKLIDFPELKRMLKDLLLRGRVIEYVSGDMGIRMALMYGFVILENGIAAVSNRIFETRLYNGFLAEQARCMDISQIAADEKNQFLTDGRLDMDLVIHKFAAHYTELFGEENEKFLEDNGRCIFLLYLKPIINGTGNYYIEARTRTNRRTDVIIDYKGQQQVVELKIWRGAEYNQRGEEQLADYLDAYHLRRGYMVSFNFNKKKQTGVKRIVLGDKVLIEAVV